MTRILACLCIGVSVVLTGAAVDAQPKDGYKLRDVAWFIGPWRSPPSDSVLTEEHWSEPAGGAMIGMFRLVNADKPVVYEFLLIEETADGVFMRLRHFKTGMVEVEKEPIKLKLAKATAKEAVFENAGNDKPKRITYSLAKSGQMIVEVESVRDGKKTTFTLKMDRMKK